MSPAVTTPVLRRARGPDLPGVLALLAASALPADGVDEHFADFVVAEAEGRIVGTAGVECHRRHALLRSVAVDAAYRGQGLGRRLVEAAIARATANACGTQWLLTTTADDYFPRFGFVPASRDAIPDVLHGSAELTGACPASAVLMKRERQSA